MWKDTNQKTQNKSDKRHYSNSCAEALGSSLQRFSKVCIPLMGPLPHIRVKLSDHLIFIEMSIRHAHSQFMKLCNQLGVVLTVVHV